MVKWKSKHFSDLKPFDIVSLDNLLDRTKQTMLDIGEREFIQQWNEGRAFIKVNSDNPNYNEELSYLTSKYNNTKCPYPTKTQIVLHQYRPYFTKKEYHTEENRRIFEGLTTNVNSRDGFIVGGFSEIDMFECYIKCKEKKYTSGDWIYLEIPYNLIWDYMVKSINSAPLTTAKKFITQVDSTCGWSNFDKVSNLVKEYDEKFPNWNHDFPIKSYIQVKEEGLLFPCQWWDFKVIASNATHRMVMMGFNKYDIPFVTQIPYGKTKWYAQSREPMFFKDGEFQFLTLKVDIDKKLMTYGFSNDKFYTHWKSNPNLI